MGINSEFKGLKEDLNFSIDGFSDYIILKGIVRKTAFYRTLITPND